MPIAERDLAIVAAARRSHRTALLLAAVDVIRELIVGAHVVELRRRLVVPGTPGAAVVHADGRPLVEREQDDVGVLGIDPDRVIVVAARRALDGGEALAGVVGAIGGCVGDVDDVFILGIDAHAGEVRAAAVDAIFAVDEGPGSARIVGAIESAGGNSRGSTSAALRIRRIAAAPPPASAATAAIGFHQGVHAIAIAGRDADADAAEPLREGGQSAGELRPVVAAVGRFEESTIG